MRNQSLKPLLAFLPVNAFAPNVILSGLAGRARLRIHEEPVTHQGRVAAGAVLLVKWTLLKAAFDSFGPDSGRGVTVSPGAQEQVKDPGHIVILGAGPTGLGAPIVCRSWE